MTIWERWGPAFALFMLWVVGLLVSVVFKRTWWGHWAWLMGNGFLSVLIVYIFVMKRRV